MRDPGPKTVVDVALLESLVRVDDRVEGEEANQDVAGAGARVKTSPLAEERLEVASPVVEAALQRHFFPCVSENLRGVREGEKGYGASDEALEALAAAAAADADLDEGVGALCASRAFSAELFLLLAVPEDGEVCLEAVEMAARPLQRRRRK